VIIEPGTFQHLFHRFTKCAILPAIEMEEEGTGKRLINLWLTACLQCYMLCWVTHFHLWLCSALGSPVGQDVTRDITCL
jgi:hypothetical protein